jgi:hypothetical protein
MMTFSDAAYVEDKMVGTLKCHLVQGIHKVGQILDAGTLLGDNK